MNTLDRKMLRDLRRLRGQATAIALLVACAVATMVGALGAYGSLERSRDVYYDAGRFGHLFARLTRAPEPVAERLRGVPGVAAVETRAVELAHVKLEAHDEPVSALLISVPDGRQPTLHSLRLRAGRLPESGPRLEAVASEAFAAANALHPGDTVSITLRGLQRSVQVVGIALSPEAIYSVRPGEMVPDHRHFGVLWVEGEALRGALDMRGSFNDVVLQLTPHASPRRVIYETDDILRSYGGLGAFARKDHPSHRYLADDLEQLRVLAWGLPIVFFAVAAYLVNMVMTRLLATQREQVATLKAIGYGNREVALHYLKLVSVIVLAGSALGAAAGVGLAWWLATFYVEQLYRLPALVFAPRWDVMLMAGFMAWATACAGVAGALRRAMAVAPAEAMRPEPPASHRSTFLERIGLARWFGVVSRMVLRGLARRPWRSALSALGISFAAAILVGAGFLGSALDTMMVDHLWRAQRQDLTVSFDRPLPREAVLALAREPGVMGLEAFRTVDVNLAANGRSRQVSLTGMADEPTLRRVLGRGAARAEVPADGLLLTDMLGQMLGVQPGDEVSVQVLEGARRSSTQRVVAWVSEPIGVQAYSSQASVNRLVGEGALVSGAFLRVEPQARVELIERLRARPRVAGVTAQEGVRQSFRDLTGAAMMAFAGVLTLLAAAIAVGVVYNAARIVVAERERELATLRVLGFTRTEVSGVLFGDLGAQVMAALPIGFALGYGLAAAVCEGMKSELFRLPLIVPTGTYLFAGLVVVAAALAVALHVRRRLDRLDLVAVLKAKE